MTFKNKDVYLLESNKINEIITENLLQGIMSKTEKTYKKIYIPKLKVY